MDTIQNQNLVKGIKKTINRRPKLNVGSYVRLVLVAVTQGKFTKGYIQQNTQEVFKIHAIK